MSDVSQQKSVLKERIGEVVSAKMEKTIVVRVERRMPHPKYKKIIRLQKKFYAHDDAGYRDWETDRKSTRLNSSHRL